MSPYLAMSSFLNCKNSRELHTKLEEISRVKFGTGVPFKVSDLDLEPRPEIVNFITRCLCSTVTSDVDGEMKKLSEKLKKSPPNVTYENPTLPAVFDDDEMGLRLSIFAYGIDLPGSTVNPIGSGHYSDFFMDSFFGNWSYFKKHLEKLSPEELSKALRRREGYCQYSPIFAPVLGLRFAGCIDSTLPKGALREINLMYNRKNEDEHMLILEKMLELGADPNAYDIGGNTALHHLTLKSFHGKEEYVHFMCDILLKNGANPNVEEKLLNRRPLGKALITTPTPFDIFLIDLLVSHNAKARNKAEAGQIRSWIETYGSVDGAVRVREALAREPLNCEYCEGVASKKCAKCLKVYYCSPACQKLDWKFHKVSCKKWCCK